VQPIHEHHDRTAFAGGIPALEHHDHGALLQVDLVAEFAHLDLATSELDDVVIARELVTEVQCLELYSSPLPCARWCTAFRT